MSTETDRVFGSWPVRQINAQTESQRQHHKLSDMQMWWEVICCLLWERGVQSMPFKG